MISDKDKIDRVLNKIFSGNMIIYIDLRPFNLLEDCDMFLASKENKDDLYDILWIAFNQLNTPTVNIDIDIHTNKSNYDYIDDRFRKFIDSCVDTGFSRKYNKNIEFLNMYHTPLGKDYDNIDPLIQDLDF